MSSVDGRFLLVLGSLSYGGNRGYGRGPRVAVNPMVSEVFGIRSLGDEDRVLRSSQSVLNIGQLPNRVVSNPIILGLLDGGGQDVVHPLGKSNQKTDPMVFGARLPQQVQSLALTEVVTVGLQGGPVMQNMVGGSVSMNLLSITSSTIGLGRFIGLPSLVPMVAGVEILEDR
ncbi:hypothetical protein NE237_001986 [Protea cynaroides]|uniref:Uncharacterized protein n=1 Tax=Protea cynaroides TaxID=273540 RepID=A0A9Q0KUC5_9MAGN|nr:hypothetical protein NE237_001986 [Protea cynaroides]